MNPVRGIETFLASSKLLTIQTFKLMNPVRGIEIPHFHFHLYRHPSPVNRQPIIITQIPPFY